MKSIYLKKKHRKKIIQMCCNLFPGYKWEFEHDYGTGIFEDTSIESLIQ